MVVGSDDCIHDFMKLCVGARRLRRHGPFLIADGGEVGRKVAQLLNDCGEQTFVIDHQPGPGVDLVGNVLDTQVLEQGGLKHAQAVILALSTDATTLFSAVIIKDQAPEVPVIARVTTWPRTWSAFTRRAPTSPCRSPRCRGSCWRCDCWDTNRSRLIRA